MMPVNALTPTPLTAPFLYRVRTGPLLDYERGGEAINDGSKGMDVRLWGASMISDVLNVGSHGQASWTLTLNDNVIRIALAFDQNMQPAVAYEDASGAHLYFYNVDHFESIDLPSGSSNVSMTGDDNRGLERNSRDVLLSYQRNGVLYLRVQREKYATEHVLDAAFEGQLDTIGMNTKNRIQFRYKYE